MEVNYIAEREAFYKWLRRNKLSLAAQSLWNALFTIANENGWPDGFMEIEGSTLLADCHFSKGTLANARKQLREAGLLEYEDGERNERCAQYKLCYFTVWVKNCTKKYAKEWAKTCSPDTKPKQEGWSTHQGEPEAGAQDDSVLQETVGLLDRRRQNYVRWLAEMVSDVLALAEFAEMLLGNRFSNDQVAMALTVTQSKYERRKVRDPTEYVKALLLDWEKHGVREKWEIEDYIADSPVPVGGMGCVVYDADRGGVF